MIFLEARMATGSSRRFGPNGLDKLGPAVLSDAQTHGPAGICRMDCWIRWAASTGALGEGP